MIDFAHLVWNSYKNQKPVDEDIYLFLIRDRHTNEVFMQMIAYYQGEEDPFYITLFKNTNDDYEVIGWVDPKKIAFDCAPEKYHTCNGKECVFSNDCSTCHLTTKLEDAKWADWFL